MWGIADNQSASAVRDGHPVANQPRSSDLRRAVGMAPLDSVLGIPESGPAFAIADQMGATLMAQWGTAAGSIAEDAYAWNSTAGAITQPSATVGHRAPKSARMQWVTAVLLVLAVASSLVVVGGSAAGHDDRAAVTEICPAPLVTLGALPEGASIDGSLG